MKYIFLISTILIFTFCKKHRKIDIEGTVTDFYTGEAISNVKVDLHSYIDHSGKYTTSHREYFTHTDINGKYSFSNAYFSKPDFIGSISVADNENYNYVSWTDGSINKKDAKLIGQTKLTRNLEALCLSKLNLTVIVSMNYNWRTRKIYEKFIGTKSLGAFNDFSGPSTNSLPTYLFGYPDGKTIYKTELYDFQDNLLKTQFDTLVSSGCGTTNNYTLYIN